MAYLAFETLPTLPAFGAPTLRRDTRPQVGFTALEWRVVALARHDDLGSVAPASRIGTMVRRLFGLPQTNILADPRLEALRRVTVLAWHHGDRVPEQAVAEFLGQGFDRGQLVLLLAEVARRRGTPAQVSVARAIRNGLLIALAVLLTAGAAQSVGAYFNDMALGALAGLLVFIVGAAGLASSPVRSRARRMA